MNPASISALAALAGSGVGAFASFATTWLTQRYQKRTQRLASESARRERLFGDFIDQASKLFVDALTHQLEDPTKIVPLYAVVSRMRLFASRETIRAAEAVMKRIVETYIAPNIDFVHPQGLDQASLDPLRAFTEACRAELRD